MAKSTPSPTPTEIFDASHSYLQELGLVLRQGENALHLFQQVSALGDEAMIALAAEKLQKWMDEAKASLG